MTDPQTGSQPQNKGGGYRGGPKRWTGSGPRPARHIPWPEIFKHHISLIEGHQKMCDMVRKHTVEGSGNHRQICAIIDRSKVMMQDAKNIARNFVDLPDTRNQVPLGSSSASMYPGYSPADHVYGEAAMQYGSAAAKAKAEGIELAPHGDLEYNIGQAKGIKRKKLAEMQSAKGSQDSSGSASGSGADAPSAPNGKKPDSEKSDAKDEVKGDAAQPSFYIDTNPTPVKLPFSSKQPTSDPEPVEETKAKKAKKAHDGELPAQGKIETEDISAEVDARMKEKEEKRLRKEEKKRRKESDTSNIAAADDKKRKRESAGSSSAVVNGEEAKKPKKKKAKKEKEGEDARNEPQKSSEADSAKKKKVEQAAAKVSEAIEPSKKRSKDDGEGKKKRKKQKLEEAAAD
ncbi:MAG: hypothetical protein Q9195_007506 [Heterodermia aff. obscurata]